jgi:hypothetical protein
MTARQLESRIQALRASVRRLLALHGICWVLGLLLPLVIAAGLADWLFHLDSMIRATLLAALAGTLAYLLYRWVLRPLLVRFADLDIAMRIEERWPGLHDRLASTIQFLRLDVADDRYGSSVLREATVRQALAETDAIDFREVIEPRPVVRALGLAAAALTAGGLLVGVAPVTSRIALTRLVAPFGATEWPQQTHFVLDEANTRLKIARGDSFGLAVKVKPGDKVPESATAIYRFADGTEAVEPLRSLAGGEFRGRIEAVNQPFRFSVTGGDDATSVRDVEVRVVPPPSLKALSIRMVPPPYTGIAAQTLAPGLTQLRAMEGARLELDAEATKPLQDAELRIGEATSGAAMAFDSTRTRFRTSIPVKSSFTFGFRLRDTEGFLNREDSRYDVRSFRDEAPRVVIDEPRTDRDVPAAATVPVQILVDDDFGIHSAWLNYKIATGESEPREPVDIPLSSPKTEGPVPPVASLKKHLELAHKWELAPLKLTPGSVITFYAAARDFDAIRGPNVGKSRELRLRIVSNEDAARQFDDARRELREELARVLAMQKQAMGPVENAARMLSRGDRLPQPQRDDLNNASMIQRQVSSRFTGREEGLSARIRRMLDDLRNFKMPNPDAQKQMENMLARVDNVRDRNLEPAEQGILHAVKGLDNQQPTPGDRPQTPAPGRSEPGAQAQTTPDRRETGTSPGAEKKDAGGAARQEASSGPSPKSGDSSPRDPGRGSESSQPQGTTPKGADGGRPETTKGQAGSQPQAGEAKDQSREDSKAASDDPTRKALAEAKTNQKSIADELQKMLDNLSEFETYRGVVKDAQELVKQQEQAMKQSAEVAARPEMTGKPQEDLTPEQRGELSNQAARQGQIRSGLQKLLERMGEMAGRLDESDPLASAALREAAEKSQKQGTAGKLGEAAEKLERNQMGSARSRQEQARNEMRDLVDSIQNRREKELARLVKELKNAENELAQTRARQARNLQKTREARRNPNVEQRREQLKRLAKEQAEIRKDLERQLQRLAKLSADAAARAGRTASGKMGQAQENMDQDQGEQADREQEEALANLEEAQDDLEETRREAEEQLAVEQLARIGDQLKSLAERQGKVVEETKSYEERRRKNEGKLTLAQQRGVRGLGQVQTGLKEETGELAETLDGAPVIALTLRRASEKMDAAAQRLQEIKTDEATEQAAKGAADRFKQLLESLKADRGKNRGQGGQGGGGGGGGGGAGGNDDGIPPTAQLKLLKSLQQEINDRTEVLDEQRRRHKELTPEQTAELKRLAEDQGVLADLVRDMTRPRRDDGEE